MLKFFKKYHKWLSLLLSLFIILFSLSGIILNHRELFAPIDINRNHLPAEYRINNWNNSAVKAILKVNENNYLIYGNIGIWQTDSAFTEYKDFNNGLPKGIDNRKICSMYYSSDKNIYAGTYFGLYKFSRESNKFIKIKLPTKEQRVVDIFEKNNSLFLLTRSHLIISNLATNKFIINELPAPQNYDNKIGLFKTLWVIHSGEIFGSIGKILVDLVAVILIFLTITGIIYFINRKRIIKRAQKAKGFLRLKSINSWNIKWHNKIGWITAIILIITTATGIFLRPPLLIAIAKARVSKIAGSELGTPNPWFDQLRRIVYDSEKDRFIISTSTGIFYSDDNFKSELIKYKFQPPVSIMGANVFQKVASDTYLIGSFEGLFKWYPEKGEVFDYIKEEPWHKPEKIGPPIGDYLVTAYFDDGKGNEVIFDYDKGAININGGKDFSDIPQSILKEARMSLWNLGLEIHTGRFYEFILGSFYILVVPLVGLSLLFIIVSGVVVWWKLDRKANY